MTATSTKTKTGRPKSDRTGRRINRTNLNYATHHYEQALLSLARANQMMNELSANPGRCGEMSREVLSLGQHANASVNEASVKINEINEELKAFFG